MRTAQDLTPMLYSFVVAYPGTAIASLRRVRRVTAVAKSEAEARAALAPLPLLFTGRYNLATRYSGASQFAGGAA